MKPQIQNSKFKIQNSDFNVPELSPASGASQSHVTLGNVAGGAESPQSIVRWPKPTLNNLVFLFLTIGQNCIAAAMFNFGVHAKLASLLSVGMILFGLFVKCYDRQFGNGRPFHWVRQTCFVVGAVVALVLGFV